MATHNQCHRGGKQHGVGRPFAHAFEGGHIPTTLLAEFQQRSLGIAHNRRRGFKGPGVDCAVDNAQAEELSNCSVGGVLFSIFFAGAGTAGLYLRVRGVESHLRRE